MRPAVILGALICASPLVLLSATASATESHVTVDYCQPLTTTNLEECCVDPRWRELIWPDQVRFCPPLSAEDRDSGRLGESVADSVDPDPTIVTDPETTGSIDGPNNPGNQLPVGGAGEKDMDNETPKTGDQGNSN